MFIALCHNSMNFSSSDFPVLQITDGTTDHEGATAGHTIPV